MAKRKGVKGHKKGCKCAVCKHMRRGGATHHHSPTHKGSKHKRPRHSPGQFSQGFTAGVSDVKRTLPLRKAKGKDSWSKGYRAGVSEARRAK